MERAKKTDEQMQRDSERQLKLDVFREKLRAKAEEKKAAVEELRRSNLARQREIKAALEFNAT